MCRLVQPIYGSHAGNLSSVSLCRAAYWESPVDLGTVARNHGIDSNSAANGTGILDS